MIRNQRGSQLVQFFLYNSVLVVVQVQSRQSRQRAGLTRVGVLLCWCSGEKAGGQGLAENNCKGMAMKSYLGRTQAAVYHGL